MENQSLDKIAIFKELTSKMAATYEAKNHDYGNSFSETVQEFGLVAAATRMMDKMSRIKSYAKKNPEEMLVKSESLEDTLLDLANYAVMTIVELKQQKQTEVTYKNETIHLFKTRS